MLHKHHITSIQHPSHKYFPEKSCLDCLQILIISWLFKNPVVIMKKIMPCLFKDTINSGLAQFDYAQSNSKNGLKAKRERSNCHKWNFFLEKQLIKLSCNYYPLSFCKIFKKFLELIQSHEDVPFLSPKWPICPEENFFGTNHYYYFQLPIGPFQSAKFLKILTADPELWGCTIFGPKMAHFPKW